MKEQDTSKTNVIPFDAPSPKPNGLMTAMNRARKANPSLAPAPEGYDNIEAFHTDDVAAKNPVAERPTPLTFRSTRKDS